MCASKRINANLNATRMAVTQSLPHPYPYMYTYINNIHTLLNTQTNSPNDSPTAPCARARSLELAQAETHVRSTQLNLPHNFIMELDISYGRVCMLCCVRGVCVNPYCKVIGNLNGQIIHHVYDCCAFVDVFAVRASDGGPRPKRNHKRCDAHK